MNVFSASKMPSCFEIFFSDFRKGIKAGLIMLPFKFYFYKYKATTVLEIADCSENENWRKGE